MKLGSGDNTILAGWNIKKGKTACHGVILAVGNPFILAQVICLASTQGSVCSHCTFPCLFHILSYASYWPSEECKMNTEICTPAKNVGWHKPEAVMLILLLLVPWSIIFPISCVPPVKRHADLSVSKGHEMHLSSTDRFTILIDLFECKNAHFYIGICNEIHLNVRLGFI